MIAMRRILDNPKRAWRNVSGIALAVFIAGITSICGFFGSAAVVDDANDPFTVFIRDIGTGGILTLVFAAVLAAVSSGVMQAGSVYDQAGEYRMLVLEGTDVKTLNRARFIEVLTPLNIVVIVAGGCSMLLMASVRRFDDRTGHAGQLLRRACVVLCAGFHRRVRVQSCGGQLESGRLSG